MTCRGICALFSAFTSDDHERQVTVWNSLPFWSCDPHSMRRALTEKMIPATNKRLQYLCGLEAYEPVDRFSANFLAKRGLRDGCF